MNATHSAENSTPQNQNISSDKKVMLMQQLASLKPEQLPENVSQDLILQALHLYKSFHFFARNNKGLEVIKQINFSIFCNHEYGGSEPSDRDILTLTSLSDFMIENVDILKQYSKKH